MLIIDDDPVFLGTVARALRRRGIEVSEALGAEQALALAASLHPRRILLDLRLGQVSGLSLITELLARSPGARIVVLTGYSSIATAVEAIRLGAADYLCKPAGVEEILAAFDAQAHQAPPAPPPDPPSLDRLEWEHIQRVLAANEGNISATARALGMHRRTLQRKLHKRPVKS